MVIQTGISGFSNQKLRLAQYTTNSYTEISTKTEKIGVTGMQIDEADISVQGRMKSRLMSLREVQNNITEAQKMMEKADKGIRKVMTILEKIQELTIQSANGIYDEKERQLLQVEVSELIDEVDRVISQTEFNSKILFEGQFSRSSRVASMWIQMGPNIHERERIFLSSMSAQALQLRGTDMTPVSISTPEHAKKTLETLEHTFLRTKKQLSDIKGYSERFKEAQIKVKAEIETLEKALGENGNQ